MPAVRIGLDGLVEAKRHAGRVGPEWIGRGGQPRGIDQLFSDLVEVLEDEQELRQLIQRLVAVAERRPVAVPGQDAVAQPVDGRDSQLRQVAPVADRLRGSREAIAHLERSLLGEGAEHDLLRRGSLQEKQVERAQHDAVGLARSGPGHDEQRAVQMRNDLALRIVQVRVVLEDGGRDGHSSPAFRKLNTSSGETIRWSRILR